MAEMKKTVDVKETAVVKESAAVVKTEPAKERPAAKPVAKKAEAETKDAAKKAAETKAPAKKTAAKKAPAKKVTAAKEAPVAKKTAEKKVKQTIHLQFAGKSYSMDDLKKIADDVWKYDLHKNEEAYESLELYVKPEESVAYYVFNKEITGSFFI